jgi:hypothetical protein
VTTIQQLLAAITPQDLTEFARAVPVRGDLILQDQVLPTRVIQNVKYRTSNRSLTVAAAKYRSFNAPTPWLRAQGTFSVKEGFLPPLGGKSAIDEYQAILQEIARGSNDQSLLDAVFDKVENQVLGIYARLELGVGDLLTDGVLTISENGQALTADFGVPSGNKPTAAVLWNAANATPLTDELAWIQYLADNGKPVPDRALTSRRVLTTLLKNTEYRDTYWGGATSGVSRPGLTVEQFNSVRGQYGLPPITTYDAQVAVENESTGAIAAQRVLPDDRFILLPPAAGESLGNTLMGITAEALVLDTAANPRITGQYAGGLVSTVKYEDDPVAVTTKTTAVGMPVLHTPDAFVTAKVL